MIPLTLSLVLSTLIGAVVVWMLAPRSRTIWATVLQFCFAVGIGLAACSVVRLLGMTALSWTDRRLIWVDAALVLGLLVLSLVTSRSGFGTDFGGPPGNGEAVNASSLPDHSRTVRAFLLLFLAVALLSAAGSSYAFNVARPHGNWDAWAMWNMKARFFYLGREHWDLAVCDEVASVRPDYPFFLPLTVARLWSYLGADSTLAPRLIAALFTGLVVLTLFAGVARARGAGSAALACITLLGADIVVEEGASQYADIQYTAFMLCTVELLTTSVEARHGANRLWALTGLLAGCAAWTKNEGLILCAAIGVAVLAMTARRDGVRPALARLGMFLLGASPLLACVMATKLAFAWRNDIFEEQTLGGAFQLLTDPARYLLFWHWFTTLLPQCIDSRLLVLLASYAVLSCIASRFTRWGAKLSHRAGLSTVALTLVLVAGCYVFIYLITPHDLGWHMRTSLSRLLLHVWPSALFVVFAALPTMDEGTLSRQAPGCSLGSHEGS